MGFFGYLGLLNCLFSIPILLGLVWGGFLDVSGVTNRTARRQGLSRPPVGQAASTQHTSPPSPSSRGAAPSESDP